MNTYLFNTILFFGMAALQLVMYVNSWPRGAGYVKNEEVQLSPRPYPESEREPIIIRRILMEDGTIFLENWTAYINKAGKADLKITYQGER